MIKVRIRACSQHCRKGLRIRRGLWGGGPRQFKTEKRRGFEMARIILIALVLTAIYFTARELLIRRILNLPQLLILCVALAAALYFLPRYGGALIALIQRVIPQLISFIL